MNLPLPTHPLDPVDLKVPFHGPEVPELIDFLPAAAANYVILNVDKFI